MKTKRKQKGIITLTFAIFALMIMVLIIGLLETRLLFGVKRNQGIEDSITSTYNAESEIYDTLARIDQGFAVAATEKTLADGTKLKIEERTDDSGKIVDITAKLPYATTKLEISHNAGSVVTTTGAIDIIFSLDCSGSMSGDSGNGKSRLHELRNALNAFIDVVNSPATTITVPVHIGISVFSGDAYWVKQDGSKASYGELSLTPDQAISAEQVKNIINKAFDNDDPKKATICKEIYGQGTSQGSGLQLMHNYYADNPNPYVKHVEILITDGEPTVAIPLKSCGSTYFLPYDNDQANKVCPSYQPSYLPAGPDSRWLCKSKVGGKYPSGGGEAKKTGENNFLCMTANANTLWKPGSYGQRDPDVEEHLVLVYDDSRMKGSFDDMDDVHVYMGKASELTKTLTEDVLHNIEESSKDVFIRKVIP